MLNLLVVRKDWTEDESSGLSLDMIFTDLFRGVSFGTYAEALQR